MAGAAAAAVTAAARYSPRQGRRQLSGTFPIWECIAWAKHTTLKYVNYG